MYGGFQNIPWRSEYRGEGYGRIGFNAPIERPRLPNAPRDSVPFYRTENTGNANAAKEGSREGGSLKRLAHEAEKTTLEKTEGEAGEDGKHEFKILKRPQI